MTITPDTHIGDIAAAVPSSIGVFQQFGIDFCCGGQQPLSAACDEHGVSFDDVAGAIDRAALARPSGQARDWRREPLDELSAFIVKRYHEPLGEELPRLQQLASRVREVHGPKDPGLLEQIDALTGELAEELDSHMQHEEGVVFPAIRAAETGEPAGDGAGRLDGFFDELSREHDHAGVLLGDLRRVTSNYAVPEWACRTFRALYEGLEQLEHEMHVHVHLENNILFPRARQLAHAGARVK